MSPFAPWVAGGCLATCAAVTARLAYRRACADIEAAFRPRPDLYRTRPLTSQEQDQ